MKAFDTDILTEILAGNPAFSDRVAKLSLDEQFVPIVAIEEMVRGRLNAIRQAEAGKGRTTIDHAYQLFEQTIDDLRELKILAFSPAAVALVDAWRKKKVKGSTH